MLLVRIVSILTFTILASLTQAYAYSSSAVEIADPHDQLIKLSYGSGANRPEFSRAFQCGQPVPFFVRTGMCNIHCEYGACEQQCDWPDVVEANFQVEECTKESAFLYSTNGHSIELTAADYKASGNTMALSLIKALPVFFQPIQKIEIDFIGPSQPKRLIENGKMTTIYVMPIFLIVYPDKKKPESTSFQLNLDLSRSGLDQLMCYTEDDYCMFNDQYFMKRKGLVNAPKP